MSKGKILITPRGYAKYGANDSVRLTEIGYELDINDTGKPLSRETFVAKAKESVGIIVGVDELDSALLEECKQLKAIVKFGVGTDNIDLDCAEKLNISVGRCVGSNSNAVAEYTIGLMFACAKNLVSSAINVKNGGWDKPTGMELYKKSIGIIGFGNIGKHVARIANGIGMKVYAFDVAEINKETLDLYGATSSTVDDIIASCDFITLHTPLVEETKNMISYNQFKRMKRTTCLINAARGGIVDEKALYEALKNKTIFAAGSDVFTSEPPKGEDWVQELIHLDNFILTPHIASRSVEAEINTVRIATDQLITILNSL